MEISEINTNNDKLNDTLSDIKVVISIPSVKTNKYVIYVGQKTAKTAHTTFPKTRQLIAIIFETSGACRPVPGTLACLRIGWP